MQYLIALLLLVGMWTLTPILAGLFGVLIPLLYLVIGFYLGLELPIVGVGGLCGCLVNMFFTGKYMRTRGALSNSPRCSLLASRIFLLSFIAAVIARAAFDLKSDSVNFGLLSILALIAWPVATIFLGKTRKQSIDNFFANVETYRIVEKYDTDPKWAIRVLLRSGEEQWTQTIPGSFLAKDPSNDLTFVFNTKEKALRYAERNFTSAVRDEAD